MEVKLLGVSSLLPSTMEVHSYRALLEYQSGSLLESKFFSEQLETNDELMGGGR